MDFMVTPPPGVWNQILEELKQLYDYANRGKQGYAVYWIELSGGS